MFVIDQIKMILPHKTIFSVLFVCLLSGFSVLAVSKAPKGCFRAATLDHVQQIVGNPFIPNVADIQEEIELNLKMYEKAAVEAKLKDADLIQYPEEGIYFGLTRELAIKLGEQLPESPTDFTYCSEEFTGLAVFRRLACIASKNRMFVSADILDVQPFVPTPERNSSRNDVLVYNTQVVFDREGRLVAKYHKMNLFNEPEKDVDYTQKPVVIETELGRLGLQICFDILFSKPGHDLAVHNKVDTILYPTWWLDELPFLQASQVQGAFARSHNISLIASNIHNVSRGARGSGIYSGLYGDFSTINDFDGKTKLLVANLPITPTKQRCEMLEEVVVIPQEVDELKPENYFHLNLAKSQELITVPLNFSTNQTQLVKNGVFCSAQYDVVAETLTPEEEYFLIAANRTKPGPFPFNEIFCGVVQCPRAASGSEHCTEFQQDSSLKTRFRFMMVIGGFPGPVVTYPSVIGDRHHVIAPTHENNITNIADYQPEYDSMGVVVARGAPNGKLQFSIGTIGAYGRNFKFDKKWQDTKIPLI